MYNTCTLNAVEIWLNSGWLEAHTSKIMRGRVRGSPEANKLKEKTMNEILEHLPRTSRLTGAESKRDSGERKPADPANGWTIELCAFAISGGRKDSWHTILGKVQMYGLTQKDEKRARFLARKFAPIWSTAASFPIYILVHTSFLCYGDFKANEGC